MVRQGHRIDLTDWRSTRETVLDCILFPDGGCRGVIEYVRVLGSGGPRAWMAPHLTRVALEQRDQQGEALNLCSGDAIVVARDGAATFWREDAILAAYSWRIPPIPSVGQLLGRALVLGYEDGLVLQFEIGEFRARQLGEWRGTTAGEPKGLSISSHGVLVAGLSEGTATTSLFTADGRSRVIDRQCDIVAVDLCDMHIATASTTGDLVLRSLVSGVDISRGKLSGAQRLFILSGSTLHDDPASERVLVSASGSTWMWAPTENILRRVVDAPLSARPVRMGAAILIGTQRDMVAVDSHGERLWSVRPASGWVRSIACTRTTVSVGDNLGGVVMWNGAALPNALQHRGVSPIQGIVVGEDGAFAAINSAGWATVGRIDAPSDLEWSRVGDDNGVDDLKIGGSGALVLRRGLGLYRLSQGSALPVNLGGLAALTVAPTKGRAAPGWIVACANGKLAKFAEVGSARFELRAEIDGAFLGRFPVVALGEKGAVFVGGEDGAVGVYDSELGCIARSGATGSPCRSLSSHGPHTLLAGHRDGSVFRWDFLGGIKERIAKRGSRVNAIVVDRANGITIQDDFGLTRYVGGAQLSLGRGANLVGGGSRVLWSQDRDLVVMSIQSEAIVARRSIPGRIGAIGVSRDAIVVGDQMGELHLFKLSQTGHRHW